MNEEAVVFPCEGEQLVGVLSVPATAPDTGVLLITGGPQYRVGSHRQFTQIAWHLAENGVAAMRFDTTGMGDSSGAERRSFVVVHPDVGAALNVMFERFPTMRSVALWGLCGGATAALLYCHVTRDPRVGGMVLVNPWIRTEATQARTRVKHYYLQRLLQREFWGKLVRGRIGLSSLSELFRAVRLSARAASASGPASAVAGEARIQVTEADLGHYMARSWSDFAGRILLILSERDYTAKEFLETAKLHAIWQANLTKPNVQRVELADADHTFAQPQAHAAVELATLEFARTLP